MSPNRSAGSQECSKQNPKTPKPQLSESILIFECIIDAAEALLLIAAEARGRHRRVITVFSQSKLILLIEIFHLRLVGGLDRVQCFDPFVDAGLVGLLAITQPRNARSDGFIDVGARSGGYSAA